MPGNNYTWDHLDKIQLLKYAEYFVKMELTRYGLDIYNSATDNNEVDFSAKTSSSKHYDFQIRTVKNFNYVAFPKDNLNLRENLIVAIVIFVENKEPCLFFIPSTTWKKPDEFFVSSENGNGQDKPEWGLNLSNKYNQLLAPYSPEIIINTLKHG